MFNLLRKRGPRRHPWVSSWACPSAYMYLNFFFSQSTELFTAWGVKVFESRRRFFTHFSLFYFLCGQQWFFAPIFCLTHLLGNFSSRVLLPPSLPRGAVMTIVKSPGSETASAETTNYQLLKLPFHALLSLNLIGSVATTNISKSLIFWQLDIPIIF